MAILIDAPQWQFHGRRWSHMISDTSIEELHSFARQNLVRYMSFGLDHYDIPESLLEQMVSTGARRADSRELVQCLRRSRLRRPEGKDARTWRVGSIIGPDGAPIVEPGLLADATAALNAKESRDGADKEVGCFTRPNTAVVVLEGDRDPGRSWPAQTVVSRYGARWALEFVVGEF